MTERDETPSGRFVLLEHSWDGVHWDFMLERDDRLRTWALDEPPTESREVRARALPDHRSAYLDYEGPISGGRGSVVRVDEGVYRALEWGADLVRVVVEGRQVFGEIRLSKYVRGGSDPGPEYWKLSLGKVDWRMRREGS